ncbi:MAG TPA: leucyl/phenylalanyl-tRNA--protein transferase [Gammaproteobacteria bacterium]|nr:leucyl/phenylalanyl-tRNA--protein transferase [Gammaproteobacteria bacterium]
MVSVNGLQWLDADDDITPFAPPEQALTDPNGLLAVGGSLSPQRLTAAYRSGIFPWFSEGQPVLWWSPDPRAVFYPAEIRISRSLRKRLRRGEYRITADRAFARVITACAQTRADGLGTWITASMREAYCHLHELGVAHSVEAWYENELAGGLYGVALGRVFFGESMFSRRSDASKAAFVALARQLENWGYAMIDGQVPSRHLASLGARLMPRAQFIARLEHYCQQAEPVESWAGFGTTP